MKFEILCKQTKKSYVNDLKVKVEFVESKFYLHSDELERDIPINPVEYNFNGKKSSNRDLLKTFSKVIKLN